MHPRLSALALLTLLAFDCAAQFTAKVQAVLVSDSTKPPDFDTAYVVSYRNNLVVSGVCSYQSVDVDISDKSGNALTYTTNTVEQYGGAVHMKWLSLELTFGVPALSAADPDKGDTFTRTFGFGITGRRLWFRNFWNTSRGFYVEDPTQLDSNWTEDSPYPVRHDLESLTYMASADYAFNKRGRFSQVAALNQLERQKRSAGSWVVGGAFWYSRISSDSSLVPIEEQARFAPTASFDRLRRYVLGANGGYTHTFSFWGRGYITALLLIGPSMQRVDIRPVGGTELQSDWRLGEVTEFRTGGGYNGDRWYAGLTTAVYANIGDVTDDVSLGTATTTVRLAVGMRFRAPRISGMEKLGL